MSEDGREMMVMVDNLSGDERCGVELTFSKEWHGAEILRLDVEGKPQRVGTAAERCRLPFALGQMAPEFFVFTK